MRKISDKFHSRIFFFFDRFFLAVWVRPALNSQAFCLGLPRAGVIYVQHYSLLEVHSFLFLSVIRWGILFPEWSPGKNEDVRRK